MSITDGGGDKLGAPQPIPFALDAADIGLRLVEKALEGLKHDNDREDDDD